jgi:hypothetical protein
LTAAPGERSRARRPEAPPFLAALAGLDVPAALRLRAMVLTYLALTHIMKVWSYRRFGLD